jgi:hypothetical protein
MSDSDDSGKKRKWAADPEQRRTLKKRVEGNMKQVSGRERYTLVKYMNEKKMFSKKFLEWVWPREVPNKIRMTDEYPDLIDERFKRDVRYKDPITKTATKRLLVSSGARFAIDHWLSHGCRKDAIVTGIPELQGKYKPSNNPNADVWVPASKDHGPPWFQMKIDGHFKGEIKVGDLPDGERKRVCDQVKRQFQPGGWKPIDIDALWKKFAEQHGEPTPQDVKQWHKYYKDTSTMSKTAEIDEKIAEKTRKQLFSSHANATFSSTVRRAIFEYAKQLSQTRPLKNLTNALEASGGLPIAPSWEVRRDYRDPYTKWILDNHPEWENLPSGSVVSADDKKKIEVLKYALDKVREQYFLYDTYSGREFQHALKRRDKLMKNVIKKNQETVKNQDYNLEASQFLDKLYSKLYYRGLKEELNKIPTTPERVAKSTLYEIDKGQKIADFVAAKGFNPAIHIEDTEMNVNRSLEVARAIRNKNYDKVRQYARFALEKKEAVDKRKLPTFTNFGKYTGQEIKQMLEKARENAKRREMQKKEKRRREAEEASREEQRRLNVLRKTITLPTAAERSRRQAEENATRNEDSSGTNELSNDNFLADIFPELYNLPNLPNLPSPPQRPQTISNNVMRRAEESRARRLEREREHPNVAKYTQRFFR